MVFGLKMLSGSRPASIDDSSDTERDEFVPLTVIPQYVLDKHPELALKEYNFAKLGVCSNAIVVPHNACRLEMADMWSDILPSLQAKTDITEADMADVKTWWLGFARFALTTSMVHDLVLNIAINDVFEDFDKDATNLKKAVSKISDKNTMTLEYVFRAMDKAVEEFESVESIHAAWKRLSTTLIDIYKLVEETLEGIDAWRRGDLVVHKDLERKIVGVYTNKKRWGSDDSKRGEMIVLLTRWMGNEDTMRRWMKQNLGKKELKNSNKWMDDYQSGRLQLLGKFNKA